ncbi:MAG: radical SAM protein, partial [Selenomonadaceae bacterium]|nr:radical SAM protein [Selenomonadaceae bacterium]
MLFVRGELEKIEQKVLRGERLSREDGEKLFACNELSWLGALADFVRKKICGDAVYYNVNCHVNLTNICISRCKFCAFGRDADNRGAYAMTLDDAIDLVTEASRDPNLSGLHIVSGLHPTWTFDTYLNFVEDLHKKFPALHLKGFTGVEIQHFADISGLSVEEVLIRLKSAGLQAIAGGGAEILTDRVRNLLCPKKATADQWLNVARTAHKLGIKTNASMLYGHIETLSERVE